jgi:hypothetical protein
MSTLRLVTIWGMLIGVAVLTRQSAWDYAAGLCAIAAMLPLAIATGEAKRKRVAIPAEVRWRRAR